MAVIRVEKTKNYTVMSNYHLRDRRLSYKDKGLQSVMLSLPPNWDFTLAGLAKLTDDDGIDSVRSALNKLMIYGYVSRQQIKKKDGSFAEMEYTIYECPEENPNYNPDEIIELPKKKSKKKPKLENPTTDKSPILENPISEKPKSKKSISKKSTSEKSMLENPTQLNTNPLITNKLNTKGLNINQSSSKEIQLKKIEEDNKIAASNSNWFEETLNQVKLQVDYDSLSKQDWIRENDLNEIIMILHDVIYVERETIRINSISYNWQMAKSIFCKLTYDHIFYVIESLYNSKTRILYMRDYIITALYNSYMTLENHYTNKMKVDTF